MLLESAGARGEAEAIGDRDRAPASRRGRRRTRSRSSCAIPRTAGRCSPACCATSGSRSRSRLRSAACGDHASAPRSSPCAALRRRARRPAPCSPTCAATRSQTPERADWVERAHPPRRRADGRRGGRGLGASRRGTCSASARRPARRSACVRSRARPEASPRRPIASARRSPGARPAMEPSRRSRHSSCAPASPRPSCSTELATIGSLPGCEQPDVAEAVEALALRDGAAVARAGRGPGADHEPVPRARGARERTCSAPRSTTASSRLGRSRPAAGRGAPRALGHRRPAPLRAGRGGALPLPRLRLAADRAPLPELAGLRRGRRGGRALAVRRRRARPAGAGRRGRRHGGAVRSGPSRLAPRRRPTPRALARALALGGRELERERVLAGLAVAGGHAAATLAQFDAAAATRAALPGPLARPRCSPTSAPGRSAPTRSRAGSPAPTSGSSTTSSARSGSSRPPTRCGWGRSSMTRSRASTATRRATTRSRGPATSAAGSSASASCSTRTVAEELGRGLNAADAARRSTAPAFRSRRSCAPRPSRSRPTGPTRPCSRLVRAVRPEDEAERPALVLGDGTGRLGQAPRPDRPDRHRPRRAQRDRSRLQDGEERDPGGQVHREGNAPAPALHARRPRRARSSTRSPASTSRSARRIPASGARAGSSSPTIPASRRWAWSERPPRGPPRARGDRSPRPKRDRGRRAAEMRAGEIGRRPDRRPVPEVLHVPADLPARARGRRRRRRGSERERRVRRRPIAPDQLSLIGGPGAEPSNGPVSTVAEPRATEVDGEPAPGGRPSSRRPSSGPRSPRANATPSSRRAPAPARRGPGRPLLRRDRRGRRRGRADPRLHLHRARRGRDADPDPPRADAPLPRRARGRRQRAGR